MHHRATEFKSAFVGTWKFVILKSSPNAPCLPNRFWELSMLSCSGYKLWPVNRVAKVQGL